MTTYEYVKSALLTVALVGLFLLGVKVYSLLEQADRTLVYTQASLYSINGVGPQAIATLKTFDTVAPQLTATLATVQASTRTVNRTASKAGAALDGLSATLAAVNRPCGSPALPCGTLADVNRTLATVRGTFGQIEVAANHEDRNLSTLDAQEAQLYSDVHTTTTDLNVLIASPDIARFLKSSADTSAQVAAIATDVHKEADALTAPKPWYQKLGAYGTTGVNIVCIATHSCPF